MYAIRSYYDHPVEYPWSSYLSCISIKPTKLHRETVLTHRGAIIIGNFSTRSRIISNEALPEPMIIPARKVVIAYAPDDRNNFV